MGVPKLRSVAVVGLLAGLAGLGLAQPASADGDNPGGVLAPALASTTDLFELDSQHHVIYLDPISGSRSDLGGFAVDGLAAAGGTSGTAETVLIRGTDGAVWMREQVDDAVWGPWQSLGGQVNTRPAAAESGNLLLVVVRGTDGRMYERIRSGRTWSAAWQPVNARFLGALTLGRSGDNFVVYGKGLDGRLLTATRANTPKAEWSPFTPVPARSGLVLTEPAVDPVAGNLYVRGTDGACWTFDPAKPSTGWRSLGGDFITGFAAFTAPQSGTVLLGRGPDNLLYILTAGQWVIWHFTA